MKTTAIFVILFAIWVSTGNGLPFSWTETLFGETEITDVNDTVVLRNTLQDLFEQLVAMQTPQSRAWWDPFNLFGGPATTTSTTPFPYPKVANFFTDPVKALDSSVSQNITQDPAIVQCLSTMIQNYNTAVVNINGFLPDCIGDQKLGAILMAPKLLGLLPILKVMKIPKETQANCPYKDGCKLKSVQNTVTELDKTIGGITKSLVKALPSVGNLGKKIVSCMAHNFAGVAKDLPKNVNVKCLKKKVV